MTNYIDFIDELNREIASLEQKIVDEENALLVREFPEPREFRCEHTDKNGKTISEYFDTEDDARECAKQYKTYCITNMRMHRLYLIRRERDKVIEPLQSAIKALKDVKNIFYDKLNDEEKQSLEVCYND